MAAVDIVISAETSNQFAARTISTAQTRCGRHRHRQDGDAAVLAEASRGWVAFAADVKGDLSGITAPDQTRRHDRRPFRLATGINGENIRSPGRAEDRYPVRATQSESVSAARQPGRTRHAGGVLYAAFHRRRAGLLRSSEGSEGAARWMVEHSSGCARVRQHRCRIGRCDPARCAGARRTRRRSLFGEPAVALSDR